MKTTTMRYYDAIHTQLDALTTWQTVAEECPIVQFVQGPDSVRSISNNSSEGVPRCCNCEHWGFTPNEVEQAPVLLARAEPYFLDGDIQNNIMDSVDSFPEEACIGDVLPPSQRGWVLFETPIPHPLATADLYERKHTHHQEQKGQSKEPCLHSAISSGWAALAWSTTDPIRNQVVLHCPCCEKDRDDTPPALRCVDPKDGGPLMRCINGCSSDDLAEAFMKDKDTLLRDPENLLNSVAFRKHRLRLLKAEGLTSTQEDDLLCKDFIDDLHEMMQNFSFVTLDFYHRTDEGSLILSSTQSWPFHKSLREWKMTQCDKEGRADFVISLFSFMKQPFSTVESRNLPRAYRRSLQRKTGLDAPKINVIALRRAKYAKGQSNPEGGTREWSSRWIVKGHWRNQYYPSKQKNSPLWIMPYVKGPEDKPLKGSNSISLFHVTR